MMLNYMIYVRVLYYISCVEYLKLIHFNLRWIWFVTI